jgi:3-hydroxy-9,10-secoandrosta-1,3,5(10)-triene-9,17-dione monooxygenase reductase component
MAQRGGSATTASCGVQVLAAPAAAEQHACMSESLVALMRHLTLGVYVIGVCDGAQANAFTACSVMSVSFDPALLALAIGRDHASLPLLRASRHFTVNVLARGQLQTAQHFGVSSGREAHKLSGIPWQPDPSGAPLLRDALASLSCEVRHGVRAGDHELFVSQVTSGVIHREAAAPLTYADTGNMDGSADLYGQHRVPTIGIPHEPNKHR